MAISRRIRSGTLPAAASPAPSVGFAGSARGFIPGHRPDGGHPTPRCKPWSASARFSGLFVVSPEVYPRANATARKPSHHTCWPMPRPGRPCRRGRAGASNPLLRGACAVLSPLTGGGVDAVEVAAGVDGEEARGDEAGAGGEEFPGVVAEGVGNPAVAVVGVVLDQEQASAGSEVAADQAQHRLLVPYEVERVGHDDAVAVRQRERAGEVGYEGVP